MERYFGESIPKLGFGLMRLPQTDGKIDIEQVKTMVDMFMEAGLTYFDTAFVYGNGDSERAAREALVDRYPRESFQLATKLNAWMGKPDEETAKKQLEISLERTGAGYFDFYLLHAVMMDNYETYENYGLWDFVKQMKAEGKIKHWGFSFHATPEKLDELLTLHPDAEFVQLQLNYADWENPHVQSRRCYEVARKHGKSIVVMEPVKGGALANPPKPVQQVLKAADENASFASWAIRYVASLDGIITVLSGMSNIEQMADNLSYMKEFKPLDEAGQRVIEDAKEALAGVEQIACTACSYCTEGCPMNIPIPDIFKARNRQLIWDQTQWGKNDYKNCTEGRGKASDCIKCGQCEGACPQQLSIISYLEDCVRALEE